ncbi:hypothetical protein KAR91_02145 [Candidatus Pacearchaeota archaeon]|nr:hypothetical protein [Candidatus Pacearchaeota archaeon]
MPILATDIATIKGALTIEKLFAVLSSVLKSQQILAGGYDPLKTGISDNTPYALNSAAVAAELFGFGSQLHRMAIYYFSANGGASPVIAFPLPAAAGGAAATKTITFATNATSAGSYVIRAGSYLDADKMTIGVATAATPDAIAALVVTAVTGNPNLPFTAAAVAGVVTLTAKTKDETSEKLSVTVNHKTEEALNLPGGMTVVVANGISGTGQSALTALWTYIGDETTPWETNIVQPYTDTAALDGASTAIGNPNQQTGLYDEVDYRPAHSYTVDTDPGTAALTAAIVLGESRKEFDPANCRAGAPDYPELGYEIASYLSGFIAKSAVLKSSNGYTKIQMPLLFGPLDPAEDWTTKGTALVKSSRNRENAVKAGITPIIYKNNIAKPGDVTTFWHPESNQNAPFKYVVNARKIWNCQNITDIYLNGDELADRPIVDSVAAVKQSENAIDTDTILAGLAQIAGIFESFGWVYNADFTIRNMTVTENAENPDRFDIVLPLIISGNLRISRAEIQVDRNLQAVELQLVA